MAIRPMKKRLPPLAMALTLLLYALPGMAIAPFVITDIRVEGNERLDEGTIFNYLPLQPGDEVNDEEARLSIKALFGTGFFKDVALEQDGTVLVVKVVERPSIAAIEITGNTALNTEAIQQALTQNGLIVGRIFNPTRFAQIEREIQNQYLALGRYSTTVEVEREELERNRINVTLKITEGRVATIKKINIIGAEQIAEKKLLKEMSLRDKRGWRFFSKPNQYSKQKLEADLETIRSYYLDRGYHDFEIVAHNVNISPNKQNIFISISIDEGDKYVFGETTVEIDGESGITGAEELLTIPTGAPFSRKIVQENRARLLAKFADAGYAFAEVRPIYETDEEADTVKTIFAVTPNRRVYVRRVIIRGNVQTRDTVIRRELRQFEGAFFSAAAVAQSRARLQRLGYFQTVTIDTPRVPGVEDQVDVIVTVAERETGQVAFHVGYSDSQGTLLGASYGQKNVLGTGNELHVNFAVDDETQNLTVSYTDPFHTPDGIERTLSARTTETETDDVNTANFTRDENALGVAYKIPVSETNSINFGAELSQFELITGASSPFEFLQLVDEDWNNPSNTSFDRTLDGLGVVMTTGFATNSLDDIFFPTRGVRAGVSMELSAPGSDHEYYRVNLSGDYYQPLPAGMAIKLGGSIGYGGGYGDTETLPFNRRYFAGGSNSVRGYDGSTLGPRSSGVLGCTGWTSGVLHRSRMRLLAPLGRNEALSNDATIPTTNAGAYAHFTGADANARNMAWRTAHANRRTFEDNNNVAELERMYQAHIASGMSEDTLTGTLSDWATHRRTPGIQFDVDDNAQQRDDFASNLRDFAVWNADEIYFGRNPNGQTITGCTADTTPDPVGGDQRLLVNAEILLPAFGKDGNDKRFSIFVDGGMVFGDEYDAVFRTLVNGVEQPAPGCTVQSTTATEMAGTGVVGGSGCFVRDVVNNRTDFDLGELRYSAGIAFKWLSPVGTFSVTYAEPLNAETGDDTEKFQINLGGRF